MTTASRLAPKSAPPLNRQQTAHHLRAVRIVDFLGLSPASTRALRRAETFVSLSISGHTRTSHRAACHTAAPAMRSDRNVPVDLNRRIYVARRCLPHVHGRGA